MAAIMKNIERDIMVTAEAPDGETKEVDLCTQHDVIPDYAEGEEAILRRALEVSMLELEDDEASVDDEILATFLRESAASQFAPQFGALNADEIDEILATFLWESSTSHAFQLDPQFVALVVD